MVDAVDIDIIASGGVSKEEDIKNLKDVGAAGAIIGMALYAGSIDLRQSIEVGK